MSTPIRPVFYDESRRRWSWVRRFSIALLLGLAFLLSFFLVSILATPLLPHNALPKAKSARDVGNAEPVLTERQQARRRFAQRRDRGRLEREIVREERARAERARIAAQRIASTVRPGATSATIVAGFYVNWEETSRASLRRHVNELTHFIPEWLHITTNGEDIRDARISEDRVDVDPFVRAHGLPIIPIIDNYLPTRPNDEEGTWNTEALHRLLANPGIRTRFISKLLDYVRRERWQGINIDFEQIAPDDRDNLTAFIRELYAAFHPAGLLVTQDIQLDDMAFDLASLARYNDYLMPMCYDEHSPGDENGSGSVAGIPWMRQQLARFFALVPAEKTVLALGNYAYDWKKGDLAAASLTFQAAVIQAKESADPHDPAVARIRIDPASLNPYYRYFDDDGAEHVVWMLDAASAYNQWEATRSYNPRGVALWYLGSEDPGVWSVLGRSHLQRDTGPEIDRGALDTITYGRQAQVDFEGEGELLEVVAEPSDGRRKLARDAKSGLITREDYFDYPSAFVVRRYGYRPKSVVLTFDDGPDPTYTPQILDILKREGVPATFFVVGQQAESHPDLIARMWDEGHEIGNHTFTHPNLSLTGPERTLLEISMTQRIIEAVTNHTSTLFRPPYAIDVEPRTGGELRPILQASRFGFITVGEMNDPQDWNLYRKAPGGGMVARTADEIVQSVWENRDTGNVVLLHDGGGDRSITVAALPRIIEQLKRGGYRFITIADLRGVSRNALFPPVTNRNEPIVGVDRWVFEAWYLTVRILVTLFALSVILGVTRQVLVAVLALIQRSREQRRDAMLAVGGGAYAPIVSVIIAAYNEEKVIAQTVRTILASDYANLEVIVVDDGSRDDTHGVVSRAFAGEPRVISIQKENGGKASALNCGLADARGDVIVALDADTLFAPNTIGRLVRHFRDPKVGAVSGNVRVGNANNILTRWQALEYITSQNFDRRAYDLLNCITVVPGAVGAWRKEAIFAVGGYTHDTLAEDTDLTWKIRRAGWRILNDSTALAFTEAPESLKNLARQRFRWAFGTLQNLWKHREAMFEHGAFGWFALPSLWLYQILFPAISPIMDLAVIAALIWGNFAQVFGYYLLMIGVEFLGATLALRMDRGNPRLLGWLLLQRFVYRQLMYYVILKSVAAAIRGGAVGWNKFERRGTARMEG